ncbi:MAG: hypothetical protein B6D39_11255 [Anaerolineae bacterium UTCFX2]|nr:MAG: hypothetical protein B6D39_11255 [Anaerolineae bacterium UTCFX2]
MVNVRSRAHYAALYAPRFVRRIRHGEMMTIRPTTQQLIHTLDLNFMDLPGAIASYLIPHTGGAVLVECGPGSTLVNLTAHLKEFGLAPGDITDVLLTHIHLDHAGSAGWWAKQGARIHVHPVGAPHLANPEKLLASAERIYGENMHSLWGEFLPVPQAQIVVHQDQEPIEIEDLLFRPLDTPGHAYHHYAYIFAETCFSGDIGGIRLAGLRHLRLPMPPPEIDLELWRASVERLAQEQRRGAFTRIAPTHFGIYADAEWHLRALADLVQQTDAWVSRQMAADPSIEELNRQFIEWTEARSQQERLSQAECQVYETANPSWMSAAGIHRYWHKTRNAA